MEIYIYIYLQYSEYIVKNLPTKKNPSPHGFSAEYTKHLVKKHLYKHWTYWWNSDYVSIKSKIDEYVPSHHFSSTLCWKFQAGWQLCKRTDKIQTLEKKGKTVLIWRQHTYLCRKFHEIYKTATRNNMWVWQSHRI